MVDGIPTSWLEPNAAASGMMQESYCGLPRGECHAEGLFG